MKSNKTLAALVTLGLAAAVATPAMALENQVSGSFTSFYELTNYGDVYGQKDPVNKAPKENFFVQRARLGYTAKASEQVKLVSKFELDYTYWGNSSYTTGRNSGGAIGADSVNIETKNLYLELNYPALNTKIGMQGVTDAFKGTIFDADMAGVLLGHEYSNASVAAGFFRWNDSSAGSRLGKDVNDMFMIDAKYKLTKDVKLGGAYYFIADSRATTDEVKVHTLGINAEGAFGPLTLNGFAVKQFGDLNATTTAKGYELNVGAKYNLGALGTARCELLYVPGGKNTLYNADNGNEGGGFYDNEMVILGRDKNAFTIDAAIVFDVANAGQGVVFGSLGYDYAFNDKLSASANAGFAAVAKDVAGTHKSDYLGTEVNAEVNYKLAPSVTLGARAGYVVLGDYFAGTSADDPYDVKIIAKYSF